jgi:hypothetical protein
MQTVSSQWRPKQNKASRVKAGDKVTAYHNGQPREFTAAYDSHSEEGRIYCSSVEQHHSHEYGMQLPYYLTFAFDLNQWVY